MNCPDCQAEIQGRPEQCPECGIELRAPAPPRKQSDAAKYAIIAVSVLVVLGVLAFVASNMGGSTCKECKGKGYTLCMNCKDGVNKCLSCKGTGSDLQTFSTCQACNGKRVTPVCQRCKGQPKKSCPTCQGSGQVSE